MGRGISASLLIVVALLWVQTGVEVGAFGSLKPRPRPIPLDSVAQSSIVVRRPGLLVTHATTAFDGAIRVKPEIDRIIKSFKAQRLPVFFLMGSIDQWEEAWYTADSEADEVIYSGAGEHFLQLRTQQLTFVGGYFKACFSNTVHFSIESSIQNGGNPFELVIPMRAIYASSTRSLYDQYVENYGMDPVAFAAYIETFLAQSPDLFAHSYSIWVDGDEVISRKGQSGFEFLIRFETVSHF